MPNKSRVRVSLKKEDYIQKLTSDVKPNSPVAISLKKPSPTITVQNAAPPVPNTKAQISQEAAAYLAVQLDPADFAPYLESGEYVLWYGKPRFGLGLLVPMLRGFAVGFFSAVVLCLAISAKMNSSFGAFPIGLSICGFMGVLGALGVMLEMLSRSYAVTNYRVMTRVQGKFRSEKLSMVYDAQRDFLSGSLYNISFKTHKFGLKDNIGPSGKFLSVSDGEAARIINTLSQYNKNP